MTLGKRTDNPNLDIGDAHFVKCTVGPNEGEVLSTTRVEVVCGFEPVAAEKTNAWSTWPLPDELICKTRFFRSWTTGWILSKPSILAWHVAKHNPNLTVEHIGRIHQFYRSNLNWCLVNEPNLCRFSPDFYHEMLNFRVIVSKSCKYVFVNGMPKLLYLTTSKENGSTSAVNHHHINRVDKQTKPLSGILLPVWSNGQCICHVGGSNSTIVDIWGFTVSVRPVFMVDLQGLRVGIGH